ncbi:DS13B phosphatase, partial [Polyodon spathula]|nr:DS13B phosphatase [Polyodon spathula]
MKSLHESKNLHLSVKELEKILDSCKVELTQVDEVWPNLYIGNVAIAQDRGALQSMGITHVLNAAHSKQGSFGHQSFYGKKIKYYGIAAEDSPEFDLSIYFKSAAQFIHKGLKKKDGKVLVHCILGMSRSASLVLAYLMLYHHLSLEDVIRKVIQTRAIYPNRSFLKQLLDLDIQYAARDKRTLLNLGITHIVNAAQGICQVNTGAKYYRDTQMHYLGVEADDEPEFDLSPFFYPTAKFISAGLGSLQGKVFVNCAMGVSRSATLVLAYLMICKNVTLLDAIKAVCKHRDIFPNSGFLSQLRQLDLTLTLERRKEKEPQ